MELLITALEAGVTLGLLYALFAVGLGLTLRGSGALNLAHGDSLMLATYVGVGTVAGASSGVAVLVTVLAGAAVGAAAYLLVYAPVTARQRPGSAALGFLPSLGVALVVRNVAVLIDPDGSRPVDRVFAAPDLPSLGGARIDGTVWWLVPLALLVPALLAVLVRRTSWGRRLRAVSDDPVLARVCGIPLRRTLALTYAAAGAVGGLAGALWASFFGQLSIGLGWQATLAGFIVVVLGGAAGVRGALAGGLVLGLGQSLTGTYVSTTYRDALTYALLVVLLVLAPRGIHGGVRLRTV